jgi:predicted RNA binding protein YcfA (HicA-like mRNA interferase family)
VSEVPVNVVDVGVRETLERARAGSANLRFRDVTRLVEALGFRLVRVSGSHHIFTRPGVPELVNLQEVDGKCKPYQLKQVLKLIDRYSLGLEDGR